MFHVPKLSLVVEVAATARREGLLTSVGLPPQRGSASSTSSSNGQQIQTEMLSVVSEVSSTTPSLRSSISPLSNSSSSAPPSLTHSHSSASISSNISRSINRDVESLDFSCNTGDYVAILAPGNGSSGHHFWIAEAAAPIRRPNTDEQADSMVCKVFYFRAIDDDYLTFNLEGRKRSESNIRETPYNTLLTRALNINRERGLTTRITITIQERERLKNIALRERVRALD